MDQQKTSSYLVFTSRARALMSSKELLILLNKCAAKNQQKEITGMLLYMEVRFMNKLEGRFIQLIEGEEIEINLLFNYVKSDDRHDSVQLLAHGKQSNASFDKWSMSFTGTNIDNKVYQTLDQNLFQGNNFKEVDGPVRFLKTFYDYNMQLEAEFSQTIAGFIQ